MWSLCHMINSLNSCNKGLFPSIPQTLNTCASYTLREKSVIANEVHLFNVFDNFHDIKEMLKLCGLFAYTEIALCSKST